MFYWEVYPDKAPILILKYVLGEERNFIMAFQMTKHVPKGQSKKGNF